MVKSVFQCPSYRVYIREHLGTQKIRSGIKGQFAAHLQIQSAYLSKVLTGAADLNLEQAERANRFFHHTETEAHFFLLLVQHDRAGTSELRRYFQKQIAEIKKNQQVLKEQVRIEENIVKEFEPVYYSSWVYSAVHMASTIPNLRDERRLSSRLAIPQAQVEQVTNDLVRSGLLEKQGFELRPTKKSIHLGTNSRYISHHHQNWRAKAITSVQCPKEGDLHFSGVYSLSEAAVTQIKELIGQHLKQSVEIVQASKEEKLFAVAVDFYDLQRDDD